MTADASAPAKGKKKYEVEVISNPSALSPERIRDLTKAFIDISVQATAGDDWTSYQPGREGWANYYESPGGRPQDYSRVVLVHSHGELVHFTALDTVEMAGEAAEDVTLIWMHIAITHPQHQGGGALFKAVTSILDPDWGATLKGNIYLVFRTPNPIVYEAMRAVASTFFPSGWGADAWYPEISNPKEIGPMPPTIVALAERVAKKLSPECAFVPDTFVIKGYFKKYGPLYRELNFPCYNETTKGYFEKNLDESNQDGLMVIVSIRRPEERAHD